MYTSSFIINNLKLLSKDQIHYYKNVLGILKVACKEGKTIYFTENSIKDLIEKFYNRGKLSDKKRKDCYEKLKNFKVNFLT